MKKSEILKLKNASDEEKNSKLIDLKKDLMNMRFQKTAGQLNNFRAIREVKKSIARIMTIINDAKKDNKKTKAKKK
jgi:large subunit ribosomal protein L29